MHSEPPGSSFLSTLQKLTKLSIKYASNEGQYPGFMVTKTAQVLTRDISVPSKRNLSKFCPTAIWILIICWATTDSTSTSTQLNSSKQAQAPDCAKPYKYINITCITQVKDTED